MKSYNVTVTRGAEKYILIEQLEYKHAYEYCEEHKWTFTDGYGKVYTLALEEAK